MTVVLLQLVRHGRTHLRATLIGWSRYVSTQRHNALVVMREEQKKLRRLGVAVLREWFDFCHHESNLRRKVWATMTKRGMASAFNAWDVTVTQMKRQRQLLLKIRAAFEGHAVFRCFNAWVEMQSESASRRRIIGRGVSRIVNMQKAKSFNQWSAFTVKNRRIKHFLSRWLLLDISNAFDRWRQYAVDKRNFAEWVVACYVKLQRVYSRQVLEAWRSWLVEARLRKRAIAAVAMKMGVNNINTAFLSWAEWYKTKRALYRKIDWIIPRLLKIALISAWARWVQLVQQRQSARAILGRIINGGLARSFGKWAAYLAEAADKRHLLTNILGKMLQRDVARAFTSWAANVAWIRSMSGVVRRVLLRMHRLRAGRTFMGWLAFVDGQFAKRSRREDIINTVVRRLLYHKLGLAFTQWTVMMRGLHVAKQFAFRLTHLRLWDRFKHWAAVANHAREHRLAMLGVLIKMQHFCVGRALRSWKACVEYKRHALHVEGKVLRVMSRVKQAAAWRSMVAHTLHMRRIRCVVDRAMRRLADMTAWRALDRWIEHTRQMHFLHTVGRKLTKRTLCKAFLVSSGPSCLCCLSAVSAGSIS